MKTILYSIIAILIFSAIAAGYSNKTDANYSILIQAADQSISSVTLSQSAEIISGRLRDFCAEKFEVALIPEKNQIQVTVEDSRDELKTIEKLLVQKGSFAFYETCDHNSVAELLKDANHLFSLLNIGDSSRTGGEIGCTSGAEVGKVNDYIHSLDPDQKSKFAWSQDSGSRGVCLYALRLGKEKEALLAGTDVESMKYAQDKASKSYDVEINFRKEAIKLWSDATKRNMNKTIALVLDDKVIFCPRVNESIESGKCIISGNFTENEVRTIAALGNNGELPAIFEVVQ
jgi:preprotein translocase subunit SecD